MSKAKERDFFFTLLNPLILYIISLGKKTREEIYNDGRF